MNFQVKFKNDYGEDCLKTVRNLERTGKKLARHQNHLRFNLHCKHHDVTPVSLKLSSTVKGNKANSILKRAERQLLNVRISQTIQKIDYLNKEKGRLDSCVEQKLPGELVEEVRSRVNRSQIWEHGVTKERQINKFGRLLQKNQEQTSRSLPSECIHKWVKNCSDRLLRDPELSVLVKGLNFAATDRHVPVVEIVTQTELACRKIPDREAHLLRSKVSNLLNKPKKKQSNLSKEEQEALKSLRQDKNIVILPADKGRLTVVLNKEDYKQKCSELLRDNNTYLRLGKRDPTSSYKNELKAVLQRFQEEGNTQHHIKNSQQFAEVIKQARVEEDEELRSYDVTALFTSVPVDKAVDVILQRLKEDQTLSERTTLKPEQLADLLRVCLNCTYFVYDGIFYKQIHGAAMGSPVSPIVCNLYLEHLEQRALRTAPHPPLWWYRYVDDTHTKLKKTYADEFTDHLNSLDPDIKFTFEKEENRSLAFLDTLTTVQEDGSLRVTIYRKPTHTDQYLNFQSEHPLEHKLSVVRTLFHRAETVITDPQDKQKEKLHITQALKTCGYPTWAIEKATAPKPPSPSDTTQNNASRGKNRGIVVLPYVKGVSEGLRRIFTSHGIKTCFRPANTLRNILVAPKDKTPKEQKCGVIYHIKCQGQNIRGPCTETYIGETERSLKTRFLEHKRPSSKTSEVSQHIHIESPGHSVSLDKVEILDTEPDFFARGIKEAIYIRALQPSLNRDGGRHRLPATYNPLLTESRVLST
ncbi:uncharacterized protein LOC144865701 isoform X2 [Branchiostoma floridae x Branchiostoma japonicum]